MYYPLFHRGISEPGVTNVKKKKAGVLSFLLPYVLNEKYVAFSNLAVSKRRSSEEFSMPCVHKAAVATV